MNALLSQIVFMQPIILSALLALPVLWYILRITPPAPKTIIFPPTHFLSGLVADKHTPSKAPWWILLLRLLMAALIIIALARPVINPAESLPGQGALRLIIDNSWASSQVWNMQMNASEEAITQAGREKREIYILPTTSPVGETSPEQYGPLSPSDAFSILRGLSPNPWPADYVALSVYLDKHKEKKSIHSLWLSHGLDEGNISEAISAAQNQGSLSYIVPPVEKLPILLRPKQKAKTDTWKKENKKRKSDIGINVDAPKVIADGLPITVQALGQGGDIIDVQTTTLKNSDLPQTITFDVLETLKNKITKFSISGRKGAGSIFLLDDQFKKRKIGIAAPAQKELSAPLIESSYYIKRALEPYADIKIAEISVLIESDLSVIILPDIAAMPAQILNKLEKWVKDGGLLLRFSGPNMAKTQGEQFLLPVLLRAGGRSLSGSLSWDDPQTIAPFSEDSPFYGFNIPQDIKIEQQVLADPAQNLENKVWARLSDGTPIITAKSEGKGLIVLIHTSANTQWSDYALSGLYVSVLKRIIQLSGLTNPTVNRSYTTLDPLLIMDGHGGMISPPPSVQPIPAGSLDNITPSSIHPPGLYGHGKIQYALNIGTNLPILKATPKLPLSVMQSQYEKEYEIDIMPIILYSSLILFCLDWIIMLFVAGNGISIFGKRSLSLLFLVLVLTVFSSPSFASEEQDLRFSKGFYLAYIKTGDAKTDSLSQRGLEILSLTLTRRTSVEPVGVVGIDPQSDTLAFFPLIYWPISEKHKTYSSKAMQNIQFYLDHGGTILFDTRDQNRSTGNFTNTPNAKALRSITSNLNIPPISPIPDDHVLGRAFYLLDKYPGQYSAGILWVEQHSVNGRDNVSSVIIGSNDWASSWASSSDQTQYNRYENNYDSKQREMALRFGVNLVMYALTGNYKADQVHIPHILKRLSK